jgi:Uncharacterized protein conserved in bacteria (DUF2252)
MDINAATDDYEHWLSGWMRLVPGDLRRKHRQMRKDPFRFLRATYYRWVQTTHTLSDKLPESPRVLAVGDLHIENFGTWRDHEGRLIWGINDFDEVAELPFTDDLIRLVSSAILARTIGRMRLRPVDICEGVLLGYEECLAQGGQPFVLAEEHGWLRDTAMNDLRDPVAFWKKLAKSRGRQTAVPQSARAILRSVTPGSGSALWITPRAAGVGSLGRPRFLGTLRWKGGWIAREVKAVAPSAVVWATKRSKGRSRYNDILRSPVRCPDPFVEIRNSWLVRRLAPDCSRIELETLPRRYDEYRLMHAMGWETANIHLGTGSARDLQAHLKRLDRNWLPSGAEVMLEALHDDWKHYGQRRR